MLSDEAIKMLVRSECAKYGVTKVENVFLKREDEHQSTYQAIKKYFKYEAQDT